MGFQSVKLGDDNVDFEPADAAAIAALQALVFTPAANAAALSALANSVEGVTVFVKTYRDFFTSSNRSSPRALKDDEVLAHAGGGNWRWERLNIPHPSWCSQAVWKISGTGATPGNNEATGLDGDPIKSIFELQRRLGVYGILRQATDIEILSDLSTNDHLQLFLTLGPTSATDITGLRIKGVRTQVATGAVNTHTAIVSTTGSEEHNLLNVTGFSWAAHVGRRIRMTSGAGAGYGAWVMKDTGSNTARLSTWVLETDVFPGSQTAAPALQPTISNGDTFEITTVPSVGYMHLCLRAFGLNTGSTVSTATFFALRDVRVPKDLSSTAIGSPYVEGTSPALRSNVQRCDLGSTVFGPGSWDISDCAWRGGIFNGLTSVGGRLSFIGGYIQDELHMRGGVVTFDGDVAFQAGRLEVGGGSSTTGVFSAQAALHTVAFYDVTGDAITVNPASTVQIRDGSYAAHRVYGKTVSGAGLRVKSGGKVTYTVNKPTINTGVGAARESVIGGTNKLWSAIPYFEATNGAMCVLEA